MAKKLVTRTFTRDELEELDVPYTTVHTKFLHSSRWANHYEAVFEFEGKHYMVQYQDPATEAQEGGIDYWYDENDIEAVEVVLLPVVKHEWMPKSV